MSAHTGPSDSLTLDDSWREAYRAAVRLSGWSTALVELDGPDGLRFANSMFTQRFDDLAVGQRRASAYCDAKGRMLGLLEGWRLTSDRLLLMLDGASGEAFEARYGRYIVLDDVELEVVSEGHEHLTLLGPEAVAQAEAAGFTVPDAGGVVVSERGVVARTTRFGHEVVDLVVPGAEAAGARALLAEVPVAPVELWERLRVEAGTAKWPVDMSDKEMVHTMGLRDEVLHFEKGCYIGQETIHRLDVMGKLRKRFGALVSSSPIAVGDEVRCAGKKAGVLTTVAHHPNLGFIGLGVLRDPASTPGEALQVATSAGEVAAVAVERPVPRRQPS